MKKKLLALLLAGTMVLQSTGILTVQAAITETDKDNATEIALDTEYEVVLQESEEMCFEFVPEDSGWYEFSSTDMGEESDYVDAYVELYDSISDEYLACDDEGNGPGTGHFKLSYQLTAGNSYYYKTHTYDKVQGEYKVSLKKKLMYAEAKEMNVTINYGESAELEVIAESERGELTYQWYKEFFDEENRIENATESTYSVEGIIENHGACFVCDVSDGEENILVGLYVTIDTGLGLNEEYIDVTVGYGSTETVTVEPTGELSEFTYRWYYWEDEEQIFLDEVTGPSMEITGNADTCSTYYCEVSDGIDSITCTVNVTIDTGLYLVTESEDIEIAYNDTESVTVEAESGAGELSYEWYYWDDSEKIVLDEFTGDTLEILGDEDTKESYYCSVSDGINVVEFCVNVAVDTGLELVENYIYVTVPYGSSSEVTVETTGGIGNLTYRWYYIEDGDEIDIDDATTATIELVGDSNIRSAYGCTISDGIKNVSCYIDVTVDTGLEISDSRNVNLKYGDSVTVTAEATGGVGDYTYQWYKDDDEENALIIEGATNASYTIVGDRNVKDRYWCEVSDEFVSENYYVYVTLDTGLEFEEESMDVIVDYGSDKTVSVEASGGAGELTYQWYYYDAEEWENVLIQGATSKAYTIKGTSDIKETYVCYVSDGIVTREFYVYVTLNTGLALSDTYKCIDVLYEEQRELNVNAIGGIGELTYQWYYYDAEEWEYILIEGATNSRYTIIGDENLRQEYRCVVRDSYVSKECIFEISIDTGLSIDAVSSIYIPEGFTKVLSLNATGGIGELTYQWYYYDDGYEEYILIEDANSDEYTITADENMYTYYKCVVTDGIATAYNNFEVWKLSINDFSFDADTDLEHEYNCFELSGMDTGAYRFYTEGNSYYGEIEILDEDLNRVAVGDYNEYDGMTINCILDSSNTYYLIVYAGMNSTDTLTLKNEKLEFLADYKGESNSIEVEYNEEVTLEVEAITDTGELTYQWYDYNEDTDQYDVIENENDETYSFIANEEASESYMCRVSNGEKIKDVKFYIDIDSGLKVKVNGENGNFMIPYGESKTVVVTATGGAGELSYEWYYWDKEVDEYVLMEGVTTNQIIVEGNKNMHNEYRCKVSDLVSYKWVYAWTELESGLILYRSPQTDFTIPYGELAKMQVVASSTNGVLTYKWEYYNSDIDEYVEIQGVTSSEFTILAGVNAKNDYRCTVSDGITSKYGYFYIEYTGTITDISRDCTATLEYSSVEENGDAKKPLVTVKCGSEVLAEGTHYTVEYSNNVKPGTATVTINGIGKYTGTITKTFTITAKPVTPPKEPQKQEEPKQPAVTTPTVTSIANATVTLDNKSYIHDGKAKAPKVTVVVGGKTLANGTDYTVVYANNKNIGTATVTITGKGNYNGTATATFNINVKVGKVYTVGAYKYKVTSKSEVAFAGLKKASTKKVVIAGSVKIGGKNFKVTSIADKALQKKAKVTSVTIGANIKKIGKNAFDGCKKLKTITVKSTKIKSVGKNALKGINSKAKLRVPAKKLKTYQKLFKGKGQGKKVSITK